jgi:small subunit ribosomal protein S16
MRRPGKAHKRRYHRKIVVIDKAKARDADFIEQIGHYDPAHNLLQFDMERYENWIVKGARPSETVAALFKRFKKAAIKT